MKKLLLIFTVISLAGCGGGGGGGSSTPAVNYGSAPELNSINAQSTAEDTAKAVTLVGTDAESNSLTYSANSSTSNVVVSVSGATLTLTPASNWNGSATITAKVNDGASDSSVQTFTLTVTAVNDAPIMNTPNNLITAVNSAKTLTLSASDAEGSSLTYVVASSTSNVVASLSGATLTLTPASNWTGSATITVKANDGAVDSSSKTFTITVGANTPLLVVRIQFSDATFVSSEATWASKIFGTGTGQMNEYFSEISNGSFQFVAANETDGVSNNGVVTATLGTAHPHPVKGTALPAQRAAITAIDSAVNFAAYDTNANGFVDSTELSIIYLFAGPESAYGGLSTGVWAHVTGDSTFPLHDSVRLWEYARFGERHGTHDATIGIIAHELGHSSFHLPDLYDGSGNTGGIGGFGMMSGGSWGYKSGEDSGQTPVHPTGWSKIKMNFISPTVISSDGTYTANDINSASNNVFKIESGTSGEYFLIENRNYLGYDMALTNKLAGSGTYAGGLFITHIDDNIRTSWYIGNNGLANGVVQVEEANNAMLASVCCGHFNALFFNGNSGTFNDSSTPNSKRRNGAASNIAITSIGGQSPAIAFTVDVP